MCFDRKGSEKVSLKAYLLDKVHWVHNAVVRLVSHTCKCDRILPVLKELHWLPVKQRVIFKTDSSHSTVTS